MNDDVGEVVQAYGYLLDLLFWIRRDWLWTW